MSSGLSITEFFSDHVPSLLQIAPRSCHFEVVDIYGQDKV